MTDAWRAYLEMALGLAEVPRKKAQQVAGELIGKGGATAVQLQGLVEDALSAGMANREALTKIVRFEVDRALGVVGLATADEVTELTDRVRDLERQLRLAQDRLSATESGTAPPVRHADRSDKPAPVPQTSAVAEVAAAGRAKSAAAPAKTAAAPAKKAVAKKVAKKAVAKPAPSPSAQATTASVADAAAAAGQPAPVTDAVPGPPPGKAAAPAKKAAKKAPAKKAAAGDAAGPAQRTPANKATRKATTPSAKQGNARGPRAGGAGPSAASPQASPQLPAPPEPPRFEAPGDGEPTP